MRVRRFFSNTILSFVIITTFNITYVFAKNNDNLPEFNTKTKDVFVFKNGLGYFIQEGKATLENGWAVTDITPHATLGTYWIGSPDKNIRVDKVIGFKDKPKKTTTAITIDELLKANIGKNVTIYYDDKDKPYNGKIHSIPDNRIPETELMDNLAIYNPRYGSITPPNAPTTMNASLLLLESNGSILAINRNQIQKIMFQKEDNPSYELTSDIPVKKVKINVTGNKKEVDLGISYLSKGIGWMPSYIVDITDPDKAKVIFKATLVNDVEDLENADLHFAVGYPNFVYSDILSPMTLTESLTQFIAALTRMPQAQQERYAQTAQIMMQNVAYYGDAYNMPVTLDYGYTAGTGIQGTPEEDLYFYDLKGINLQKGERSEYPFFTANVEYQHIYEWNIPDVSQVDIYGYKQQSYDQNRRPQREQVWHSVKLFNTTDYPWTTAPAFTMMNGKPMAQDIIKYTSRGTNNNLRLTVATDVKTDRVEEEIDRQHNIDINGTRYDKVTIKGELNIKNLKSKEVSMEIVKNVIGNILEVSDNGKIIKKVEGLRAINNNTSITWQIPMKTGEEKTLTYKYEIYIR